MSFIFGSPAAPQAPPPPPASPQLASASIMEQGSSERQSLGGATDAGATESTTDVTGGQGAKAPSTTKSLLGG